MTDNEMPRDGSKMDGTHASSFTDPDEPVCGEPACIRHGRGTLGCPLRTDDHPVGQLAGALKSLEHRAARTTDDAKAEGIEAALDHIRTEVDGL